MIAFLALFFAALAGFAVAVALAAEGFNTATVVVFVLAGVAALLLIAIVADD